MIEYTLEQRTDLYAKEVDLPFFCADICRQESPLSRCEKCYANNRDQWLDCWILLD